MIEIEHKQNLLKQKNQELLVLKKEYVDYKKETISSIQCNSINKEHLFLNFESDNSFKISYLRGIVNFYAYYNSCSGFSFKAKNNNKTLDSESFNLLNNYYKSFHELITSFTKEKCNEILKNMSILKLKILNIEDEIENLENEIENDKIKLAFEEISFGLKRVSKNDIKNQLNFIKNIESYHSFKIITFNYNLYKNNFCFKVEKFDIRKVKKMVISGSSSDRVISLKELELILLQQAKIVHLDNKIIESYADLDFLHNEEGITKKTFNKDYLIQQLKMINNIKSF